MIFRDAHLTAANFILHWFVSHKASLLCTRAMIHYIRLDINMDWTYPRGIFWPITSLKYRLFCVARHEWFFLRKSVILIFTNTAELCRCCIEYPPSIICCSKTGASIFDLSLLILRSGCRGRFWKLRVRYKCSLR